MRDRSAAEILALLLDRIDERASSVISGPLRAEARRAVENELGPAPAPTFIAEESDESLKKIETGHRSDKWQHQIARELRGKRALIRKLVFEEGCPFEWSREKDAQLCAFCEAPAVDPGAIEVVFAHTAGCIWPRLVAAAGPKNA